MITPFRTLTSDRHEPFFERLNVDQYEQMIATGIIPEGAPIELIDGFLIRKDRASVGEDIMSVGNRHRSTVQLLERWLLRVLLNLNYHVTVQQPIQLPPTDEPEPDVAVIRGVIEDYFDRKPGPHDVALVVEVADSSLSFDRENKLQRYALAGIGHYWIADLVNSQIECYWQPNRDQMRYEKAQVVRLDDSISLPKEVGSTNAIEVKSLLAPESKSP